MYASPPPAEGRTKWNWKKEGTKERGSSVLLEWRRNLRRFRSFVNVLVSSLSLSLSRSIRYLRYFPFYLRSFRRKSVAKLMESAVPMVAASASLVRGSINVVPLRGRNERGSKREKWRKEITGRRWRYREEERKPQMVEVILANELIESGRQDVPSERCMN
ncbi:MAG: hypothetical protein ACTS5R_02325 [Candidatus Hodgkinia cicadicola]